MSTLRISCATVNQTPLDWTGNLQHIVACIKEAKNQGADIVCLPELALTGYGSEDLFLSYWYPQKALSQLQKVIPFCEDITVAVGLPVRIQEKVYNCMAIIEDAKLKAFVAKQFMAIDGVHYEFRWFTPWSHGQVISFDFFGSNIPLGDLIFEKKGIKYGFEICEDAWRGPVRPGFRLKERKVDVIFNPSASHFAMGKTLQREELIKESSTLFDVTYCYINLLGNESGRMIFDGEIMVAANEAILIKNPLLSFRDYQVLHFDYQKEKTDYPPITSTVDKNEEFVQAAALGLFDYLRKSKSKGFVLSLSGGADSSTIAILVSEMVKRGINELGLDKFLEKLQIDFHTSSDHPEKEIVRKIFTTAYQASENSSDATFESAKNLADSIGAEFLHWEISEEVKSYTSKIEQAIGRKLTWEQDDLALQNIQARARSPIIWMLANIKNALLLSTSNRSEGDVGYTTMDGDTSGSISPIAAVDKHFIIQWLKWAETHLGYPGLAWVNSLQPTAELRPQENMQTDESDLMPYSLIVEIERLAIRDRRSPIDIYLNLKDEWDLAPQTLKNYIKKFFRLWSRNQWKRERLAPSFHLDEFNVDPKTWYRFPILSGSFEEELKELDNN
ncbi:NAD(+) synthase [Cecembia lonarensis]|uniref:Glutamine-dependent NAD(+) synthetase n=1 Tax=Cecembia lonarensis (strain CCUG 58316 / KCTC 22772 / LW9) TaxID=1225176 RepID=K1L9J7_CECL9|nr:NAD(+) synthase [Cecembia lonarensis]EKB51281.1 Glutamine-dependent NAD(+) synthetase [Cecembia lonarensis LW9]